LSKCKCRCSHTTGRTRQVVPLLEAAIAEPSTHIDLVMSGQGKYYEESNHRYENNRRENPLAGGCPVEKFRLF